MAQLTAEDYDLPSFGPKLKELVKNVSLGRGFQLLRHEFNSFQSLSQP